MSDLNDIPEQTAKGLGLVCRYPTDRELFIDIDSDVDLVHYEQMRIVMHALATMCPGAEVVSEERIPSRTPGHLHIILTMEVPVTPMERIALQAAFGSDRKRELLSALRVRLELQRAPTVFFEKAR
jgi:hypothetical protein